MLLRCFAALLGGLGLAAAFEPFALPWLMPPAIAALVLSVRGLRPGRAWQPALVFGIAFIFSVMVWMRAVGTDAWLAMCSVEAAFFVVLGVGLALSTRLHWWPVWTALWWVAIESLRSGWPFSGMPFGRIAFATADTPWAQALPWLGMTGVSLLVALCGTTLAWALVTVRRRPVAVAVGVTAVVVATALPTLATLRVDETGTAVVAVVQGEVPGTGTDVVAVHRDVTRNLVGLTIDLAARVAAGEERAPDLVVWPENSTAVDPFADAETNRQIRAAGSAIGVPILVGAMVDAPSDANVLNQSIVWRPGLGGGDRYTKRHPVPYGEYIPFREQVWMPATYGRLREVSRDMMRGTGKQPLRVAGTEVAAAICFDVAYDDGLGVQLRHGAELVTVQTSNAMFIDTAQIDQQFAISRLRALETGRWVVVAAINGVSGVISPDAEVVASAGARTEQVLVEEVGLSRTLTPAMRMGLWPTRVIWALVVLQTLFALIAYGRTRARRRDVVARDEHRDGKVDA